MAPGFYCPGSNPGDCVVCEQCGCSSVVEQHRVKAHESAHGPAEGSDADVLMGEVAADADDFAAEPVVPGAPLPIDEPGGRRRRQSRHKIQSLRKRRRRAADGE